MAGHVFWGEDTSGEACMRFYDDDRLLVSVTADGMDLYDDGDVVVHVDGHGMYFEKGES